MYLTYIFHQRLSPRVAAMTDLDWELRRGEVGTFQFQAGVNHVSGLSLNFPTTSNSQIISLTFPIGKKLFKRSSREKEDVEDICVNTPHQSCWQGQKE